MIGCLMNMEQLAERELAGETKVLRRNVPLCHFVHCKFNLTQHNPTLEWTQATMVEDQPLSAWAVAPLSSAGSG
jgi:hypothetical protein